jgi:hypothetical protein
VSSASNISICLSLIRFTNIYDIDRALYDAGECMRIEGRMYDSAFGIWNIFLDVCDAFEDNDLDGLSRSEFKSLGIQRQVAIPKTLISVPFATHFFDLVGIETGESA